MRLALSNGGKLVPKQPRAGVSLLFDAGRRPRAAQVSEALDHASPDLGTAQVSYAPDAAEGWLELIASGLTFDLSGLTPAQGADAPSPAFRFGVDGDAGKDWEAIELVPGPHIAAGANLMPVVRMMAGLAANLADGLGARAVGWNPAETWMAPDYCRKVVAAWLAGGPFPALGLTAFKVDRAGLVESVGLRFFTGQEMILPPLAGEARTDAIKAAARIVAYLVGTGRVTQAQAVTLQGGMDVVLEPSGDGQRVAARRAGAG